MIVYEVTLNPAMSVNAESLSLRLLNPNGYSQLYEWAFVTVGTMDDAPFSATQLSNYNAQQYSTLGAGGITGSGAVLPHGKSLSQFLSGQPGANSSGGLVQPGWWAIDDFNAIVLDGPEGTNVNPGSGQGGLDPDQTILGTDLGLAASEPISGFTVWFGFYDVGFDTSGDGFTTTRGRSGASFSDLTLGRSFESIPEPSASLSCLAGLACLSLRRKR